MSGAQSATVETLTAEVRTLVVGARQVTMSVYNQLDYVVPSLIEPFGRVRPTRALQRKMYVVGRDRRTGDLVRSCVAGDDRGYDDRGNTFFFREDTVDIDKYMEWAHLPLIVLAGLR